MSKYVSLSPGDKVASEGCEYEISHVLDCNTVVGISTETGHRDILRVSTLQAVTRDAHRDGPVSHLAVAVVGVGYRTFRMAAEPRVRDGSVPCVGAHIHVSRSAYRCTIEEQDDPYITGYRDWVAGVIGDAPCYKNKLAELLNMAGQAHRGPWKGWADTSTPFVISTICAAARLARSR